VVLRLYARFRDLVHEVAKFGIIGALIYVLDSGLANLFHFGVHIGPLSSKALSTLIASTFSYLANRYWTWRHRARIGLIREYVRFFGLSTVGLGIAEACVAFTEYVLRQHGVLAYNLSANFFGVLLGSIFRFWSFKRWVFLEPPAVTPETAGLLVQ
jgi:putative flippase GtrA